MTGLNGLEPFENRRACPTLFQSPDSTAPTLTRPMPILSPRYCARNAWLPISVYPGWETDHRNHSSSASTGYDRPYEALSIRRYLTLQSNLVQIEVADPSSAQPSPCPITLSVRHSWTFSCQHAGAIVPSPTIPIPSIHSPYIQILDLSLDSVASSLVDPLLPVAWGTTSPAAGQTQGHPNPAPQPDSGVPKGYAYPQSSTSSARSSRLTAPLANLACPWTCHIHQ